MSIFIDLDELESEHLTLVKDFVRMQIKKIYYDID